MTNSKDTLQYLTLNNGKKLAYRLREGSKTLPTLVFLGGYRSDMTGTKATFLDNLCAEKGYSLLRFDYTGHGASDGDFRDGCIGDWTSDTLAIIDATIKGDMILIGSSMGGWIGLLIAKILGDRIKAFIGIAAAPDFTDWVWNQEMTVSQQNLCKQQGHITTPDGDTLTLKLFEDGTQHLIFDKPLNLAFPVTLLQGKLDEVVPYKTAQKLAEHITPNPADLILIEDGDHRLARNEDLVILAATLNNFMGAGF
jgi:pimeloyl-ACP methyl ester carboxylesterase